MKSFLLIISFFTRLPVPRVTWSEERFRKGIIFFPLVGVLLGGILYGASVLLGTQPRLPKGLILFVLYVVLSGGIHLDGLADSLDALLSKKEREKQWEILHDATLGTFGVLGLIISSLLYVSLFDAHTKALLLLPLIGRVASMCVGFRSTSYRSEGMGKLFFDALRPMHLLFGLSLSVGMSVWLLGIRSLAALAIALLVSFSISDTIKKQWEGHSGDSLGLIIEISTLIYGWALLLGGACCLLR